MLPSSYNRVQESPHRVWTECKCGWKTRKRKPGKPPSGVVFTPFHCPKCDVVLSANTVLQ